MYIVANSVSVSVDHSVSTDHSIAGQSEAVDYQTEDLDELSSPGEETEYE